MKFYTQYNPPPPVNRITTQQSSTDVTFANECDIHRIISSFGMTGVVASPGSHDPSLLQYGDSTLLPDFETAQNLVSRVTNEFGLLPSSTRAEFGNDPRRLLEELSSSEPDVIAKLERLGLKEKPVSQPPPDPT